MRTNPIPSQGLDRVNCSGTTLVEMMVAIGISGVVLAVLAAFTIFMGRSLTSMGNYYDLNQSSRNALDVMSRDIRQAKQMTSFATNQVVFITTSSTNLTFSYNYNTTNGTLVRTWTNGVQTVLLTNCNYLAFGISQRNPSNNFTFYGAATPANAKLVEVTWSCYRTIFGSKADTESVQTANIVLRN